MVVWYDYRHDANTRQPEAAPEKGVAQKSKDVRPAPAGDETKQ